MQLVEGQRVPGRKMQEAGLMGGRVRGRYQGPAGCLSSEQGTGYLLARPRQHSPGSTAGEPCFPGAGAPAAWLQVLESSLWTLLEPLSPQPAAGLVPGGFPCVLGRARPSPYTFGQGPVTQGHRQMLLPPLPPRILPAPPARSRPQTQRRILRCIDRPGTPVWR